MRPDCPSGLIGSGHRPLEGFMREIAALSPGPSRDWQKAFINDYASVQFLVFLTTLSRQTLSQPARQRDFLFNVSSVRRIRPTLELRSQPLPWLCSVSPHGGQQRIATCRRRNFALENVFERLHLSIQNTGLVFILSDRRTS